MAGKTNRWKLGLFVVAGMALAVAVVVWLGAGRRHEVITLQCFFDEAVQGLDIGSPVSHRGVPIGVVSGIRMAEEDPLRQWVRVDLDIYFDVLAVLANLPPNVRAQVEKTRLLPVVDEEDRARRGQRVWRAQLQSSLLTGVSYIQTDLHDARENPPPKYPFVPPPNTLHTVPSGAKVLMDDVKKAIDSVPSVADKVKETLGNVDKLIAAADQAVVDLNVKGLSERLDKLLADADQAIVDLDMKKISGHTDEAIVEARDALKDVRRLIDELSGENGAIQRLTNTYVKLGEDADKVLEQMDLPGQARAVRASIEEHIDPAVDDVGDLASDLRSELIYLRRTLESITRLADTLNRDPSSLLRGREPPEPIQKKE
jgi:ABC-type transporter Mla subunit MlaD